MHTQQHYPSFGKELNKLTTKVVNRQIHLHPELVLGCDLLWAWLLLAWNVALSCQSTFFILCRLRPISLNVRGLMRIAVSNNIGMVSKG